MEFKNSQEDFRRRHVQDISDQAEGILHYPMHQGASDQQDEMPSESPRQSGTWSGLGTDRMNVLVLIFLYILQGVPLGFAGSMPMFLQARGADYSTQAFFSFAFWPFSIKLLWAPIVDSIYLKRFGRRKSWLIPVQYMIALFLVYLSFNISTLLGTANPDAEGSPAPIDTVALTCTFVALCFLAATQDIAVDGWALTMLKRENVGWASTCNTIGQTAGYFLGNAIFLALESPEFCNRYLRVEPQTTGLITIQGYMYFWAWVFVISTTLTALLKSETSEFDASGEPEGVWQTYKVLWKIIKLPAVIQLCTILLTAKMAFAATDGVAGLKMIDGGMPKATLALLAVPMVPIQILLPLVISKYTGGGKPLDIYISAYPFRILMGLVFAVLVFLTPLLKLNEEGQFPVYFYALLLLSYAAHQVTLYCMYVANMAFNAKISDPVVGGTYITLLNTLTNLGGNWPVTVSLYVVKFLDIPTGSPSFTSPDSDVPSSANPSYLDGFYVETLICTVIGFTWIFYQRGLINKLQRLPQSAWKVSS